MNIVSHDKSILENIDNYLNDDIKKIIYDYYLDMQFFLKKNINKHIQLFFNVKNNISIDKNNIFKIPEYDYYKFNDNSYDSESSDY